jgi:hypothetical protein
MWHKGLCLCREVAHPNVHKWDESQRSLLAPAVDELMALMGRVRIDATTDW